jgi:hypothetical protein
VLAEAETDFPQDEGTSASSKEASGVCMYAAPQRAVSSGDTAQTGLVLLRYMHLRDTPACRVPLDNAVQIDGQQQARWRGEAQMCCALEYILRRLECASAGTTFSCEQVREILQRLVGRGAHDYVLARACMIVFSGVVDLERYDKVPRENAQDMLAVTCPRCCYTFSAQARAWK